MYEGVVPRSRKDQCDTPMCENQDLVVKVQDTIQKFERKLRFRT